MTLRHFRQACQKFLFYAFACMLPVAAFGTSEEVINDKRIAVAMRTIGHEVLMSLDDCESRIMPIDKTGDQYKIPFELEFGFDPGEIVTIVDRVMTESGIATNYLVEVEQCETREIVHSFEIGSQTNLGQIACSGRMLPEDCYSILITILDNTGTAANLLAANPENSPINKGLPPDGMSSQGSYLGSSETKESSLFEFALIIIPVLFTIGLIGFLMKKKMPFLPLRRTAETDPNVILIGASQFDRRNMALSFENKRVELSNKEAELLSLLHTSANAPVERGVILQRIWGDEGSYVGRTLDVFISKLRKKLEADASAKIVNIRGVGYKLVTDVPK